MHQRTVNTLMTNKTEIYWRCNTFFTVLSLIYFLNRCYELLRIQWDLLNYYFKKSSFYLESLNHLFKVHTVDADNIPENRCLLMSKAIANVQVQRQRGKSSCSALRTQAVQECPAVSFTLSVTQGLDLQALVTEPGVFCEWLPPPVWEILEIFFFSSLSPWIAAYVSKLPWWLRMLPACPQLSCNIWSGVLVCQWAGQSLKNIFVCKRCFLKSFKPLQRPLWFS